MYQTLPPMGKRTNRKDGYHSNSFCKIILILLHAFWLFVRLEMIQWLGKNLKSNKTNFRSELRQQIYKMAQHLEIRRESVACYLQPISFIKLIQTLPLPTIIYIHTSILSYFFVILPRNIAQQRTLHPLLYGYLGCLPIPSPQLKGLR